MLNIIYPLLRTYDQEILREFGVTLVYLNGTRRGLLPVEEKLRKNGEELINFLEEEYHLK